MRSLALLMLIAACGSKNEQEPAALNEYEQRKDVTCRESGGALWYLPGPQCDLSGYHCVKVDDDGVYLDQVKESPDSCVAEMFKS